MSKRMTWREFKDYVDEQLKKKGISQDEEIWFIDFSFPSESECPDVWSSDDGMGLSIH